MSPRGEPAIGESKLERAQEWVDNARLPAEGFTRRGHTTTIVDGPKLDGEDVIVVLRVMTAEGRDMTPRHLNPVRIVNPPIYVKDPDGDVVLFEGDIVDRHTKEVEHRVVMGRKDPAEALASIIRSLVP